MKDENEFKKLLSDEVEFKRLLSYYCNWIIDSDECLNEFEKAFLHFVNTDEGFEAFMTPLLKILENDK